jgi:transmembrane sensor
MHEQLDAMAEAERWYARLKAADCTASQRMEFQRWRATPQNAAAFAATQARWQSLDKLEGHAEFEDLSRRVLAETDLQPRSPRRGLLVASLLIALLGSGAALWNMGEPPSPIVAYTSKLGERSTIRLGDGSVLLLNTATELDTMVNEQARRVTLHTGEALFNVARDTSRAFTVTAGDGDVTALGTQFQVRNEADQVTVTLIEGRVAVQRRETGERVQLTPGEQARFAIGKPGVTLRRVDPALVTSWSTGRLRFRATPLGEVLDEVNRYCSVKISVADPALARTPVSGTFETGDSESVVAALQTLLDVRVERHSDERVLLQ